jgi:hypothetical protein
MAQLAGVEHTGVVWCLKSHLEYFSRGQRESAARKARVRGGVAQLTL